MNVVLFALLCLLVHSTDNDHVSPAQEDVYPRELSPVTAQSIDSIAFANVTNPKRDNAHLCSNAVPPIPRDLLSDGVFLSVIEKTDALSSEWIRQKECEIRSSIATGPSALIERSEVRVIWATTLLVQNIAAFGVSVPFFNARLASQIVAIYRDFVKVRSYERSRDLLDDVITPDRINDDFFFYQTEESNKWSDYVSENAEMKELIKIMQTSADLLLAEIPKSKEFIGARDRDDLLVWSSVHSHGVHQSQQFHSSSMVSALYIVSAPPASAPIVFHDPRGPYPPFDNVFTIEPKVGDMIVYPSWLRCECPATIGKEPKITLSFNFGGDWHATVASDVFYPMQHRL